jgi:hypothetical protein
MSKYNDFRKKAGAKKPCSFIALVAAYLKRTSLSRQLNLLMERIE